MKERIEKLLKEKIGTTFKHDVTSNGMKYFVLLTYGRGVYIIYDEPTLDKLCTRVRTQSDSILFIALEQDQQYDEKLVWAVKSMIQLRKELNK